MQIGTQFEGVVRKDVTNLREGGPIIRYSFLETRNIFQAIELDGKEAFP